MKQQDWDRGSVKHSVATANKAKAKKIKPWEAQTFTRRPKMCFRVCGNQRSNLEEVKFWSKSAWWHFWKDSWLFWDLWKMDMWCHIFIKTQNDKNRKNPGISCWYSQGNLNLIWIQRHSKCSVGGIFSLGGGAESWTALAFLCTV